MTSIILESVEIFLSSPTNVLLVLMALLMLAAFWSIRLPADFPPGPRGWPFVGSMFDLATDPIGALTNFSRQYGDIFSIKIGGQRAVVLNDIKSVLEALVKKQNEYAGRPWFFSVDLMTEGGEDIAFANLSPKWKALRKIAHQSIRNYASGHKLEKLVSEEAFTRLKKAICEKKGEPFQPQPLLMLMVSNVVAAMCFGQSYELDDPEFQAILKFIKDINDAFRYGLLADFVPIFRYVPTKGLRDVKKGTDAWLTLIQSKIDEHKKTFRDDEPNDLVDYILTSQQEAMEAGEEEADSLTDVNVRQTVSDIFGGNDNLLLNLYIEIYPEKMTTLFYRKSIIYELLNWCVAYLVCYPDVQAKVQREIDDVIGQDRMPMLSDKGKLPYCDAVIHEVMRIRTVAPVAIHAALQDTSVGGYKIPKGTSIWLNLWSLHMDERQWKEPEEFRPERFLDEDGKALPKPESFLPFSAGRRVCVGEILAKNEMFLIFTSLYQNYTFSSVPGKEKPSLKPTFEGLIARCPEYEVVAKYRGTDESEE
ncbi:steroid 17-alpha-hydroxylase/17,20 lyase-like [Ptychodera flava]|uniref:steroid 17-alpha-hydroxylase/17,20 lyase-like n=1 Tax=Ptychodera flava TaxID=63121 RepID=UPI00396A2F2A